MRRRVWKYGCVALLACALVVVAGTIYIVYAQLYPKLLWRSPMFVLETSPTHEFTVNKPLSKRVGIAIQDPSLDYNAANEAFKTDIYLVEFAYEDKKTTALTSSRSLEVFYSSFFAFKTDGTARHGWRFIPRGSVLKTVSITAITTESAGPRVVEFYRML